MSKPKLVSLCGSERPSIHASECKAGIYNAMRNCLFMALLGILLLLAMSTKALAVDCQLTPSAGTNCKALVANNWIIELTGFGYADILIDRRPIATDPTQPVREYLSGEWAGAIGYKVATNPVAVPIWHEPDFIFPDWPTNSNFQSVSDIGDTGRTNPEGGSIYESSISNGDLQIDMEFTVRDTSPNGIAMGTEPASSSSTTGSFLISDPQFLQQTYKITNITGQPITNLHAFQFLHGLFSLVGINDDRNYGGPFANYQYDTTLVGADIMLDQSGQPVLDQNGDFIINPYLGYEHVDYLTLHSSIQPSAWEVGYYGRIPPDDHSIGKPSVGVHLAVEGNNLDGTDFFDPGEYWVSGAQRYDLDALLTGVGNGDNVLDPGEMVSYDVLLSLYSDSTVIPLPPAVWLFGSGLLGLLGMARRRKIA